MLMVSFITAPAPIGPQCSSRRQSCSRIGFARAASAGSAPINPINLPCRAGPVEPPTGHSTMRGVLGAHLGGQREFGLRPHRAHLDEQLAVHVAGEQPRCAAIDRVDRGGIGENGDDDLAFAREFGRRGGHRGAGSGERLQFIGGAVPHGDRVSDFDEPLRDGRAHFADPGDADLHRTCLL